ncbi:MULE transposase [Brachionus plicatilis]|uniref:MULE transposase n=1 Tax=Brachionus plicatilis TaxID=10195 RepID=A0A3M7QMF3_BRAPC|nr:MULE transposase [Brachionus plicatilis]
MLKKLSEYLTVHPKSITSDFEKAFLNAVDGLFPQTKIYGCIFLFKQSMWRKIQELGLSTDYGKNALVMPQCLANLPVDDAVEAFKETSLFVESTVTDKQKIKITRARFNK